MGLSIEKSVSAKRTQLKNAEVLWNEEIRKKSELGSFCKKSLKNAIPTPKTGPGGRFYAETNPICCVG